MRARTAAIPPGGWSKALPLNPVKAADMRPGILSAFHHGEQLEIIMVDHAFISQCLEIHHLVPKLFAEQQDGDGLHLAGLDQGQQLKKLVKRANPPGNTATARARSRKCILRSAK